MAKKIVFLLFAFIFTTFLCMAVCAAPLTGSDDMTNSDKMYEYYSDLTFSTILENNVKYFDDDLTGCHGAEGFDGFVEYEIAPNQNVEVLTYTWPNETFDGSFAYFTVESSEDGQNWATITTNNTVAKDRLIDGGTDPTNVDQIKWTRVVYDFKTPDGCKYIKITIPNSENIWTVRLHKVTNLTTTVAASSETESSKAENNTVSSEAPSSLSGSAVNNVSIAFDNQNEKNANTADNATPIIFALFFAMISTVIIVTFKKRSNN